MVSRTSVIESAWIVVEEVNELPAMKIEYSSDAAEQKKIARAFFAVQAKYNLIAVLV